MFLYISLIMRTSAKKLKQVLIIRRDLDMGWGKVVAQASHASLMAFMAVSSKYPEIADRWMEEGETKIVLKTKGEEEFEDIKKKLRSAGLPFKVVKDAGQTQVTPGTETAIGVGPYYENELDKVTGKLKLL